MRFCGGGQLRPGAKTSRDRETSIYSWKDESSGPGQRMSWGRMAVDQLVARHSLSTGYQPWESSAREGSNRPSLAKRAVQRSPFRSAVLVSRDSRRSRSKSVLHEHGDAAGEDEDPI